MEENKTIQALLERVDESNQKQAKFAKWQCIFSAVAAICCAAALLLLLGLLPRINGMVDQAEIVLSDVQQMSSQLAKADWEGLTKDLEQVSQQIANANLDGIAQDVSQLVQSSQTGVEEALQKINAIDLDALNQAIADLSAVIKPLANLVSRFR